MVVEIVDDGDCVEASKGGFGENGRGERGRYSGAGEDLPTVRRRARLVGLMNKAHLGGGAELSWVAARVAREKRMTAAPLRAAQRPPSRAGRAACNSLS